MKGVLAIYEEAAHVMNTKTLAASTAMARAFHIKLFTYMAAYNLGPLLDSRLEKKLVTIRGRTENRRAKSENAYAREELSVDEFVERINTETTRFQEEMSNALTDKQYESLFALKRGETVVLADPDIVKKLRGE